MYDSLTNLLAQNDKKILFVGIGNVLKQDDGIGVYISRNIKGNSYISSVTVEVSIENYIGKINSLSPDILVLIDCVDFGKSPGYSTLLPAEKIKDLTFNTHNISLNRISEFFKMPVYILGIQPKDIDFGENLSYIVIQVADKILKLINH